LPSPDAVLSLGRCSYDPTGHKEDRSEEQKMLTIKEVEGFDKKSSSPLLTSFRLVRNRFFSETL